MKISRLVKALKWGFIPLSKHKTFEWQFEGPAFMKHDIFEYKVSWTRKCHHAGFDFTFGITKLFWMNLNIHDNRHWNYDRNVWENSETL